MTTKIVSKYDSILLFTYNDRMWLTFNKRYTINDLAKNIFVFGAVAIQNKQTGHQQQMREKGKSSNTKKFEREQKVRNDSI